MALAANSKGDIYITDWVIRQYPNHGRGRVWRLTAREQRPPAEAQPVSDRQSPSLATRYEAISEPAFAVHREALASEDAFVRAAARKALGAAEYHDKLIALTAHEQPAIRLQALLTLSGAGDEVNKKVLQKLLADQDERIRMMALIHIGRHRRADLLEEVKSSLQEGRVSPAMMQVYLSTIRQLQPDFITAYELKSEKIAKNIKRELPEGYLLSIIKDEQLSDQLRAAALPYLEKPSAHKEVLLTLLSGASRPLQEAVLHSLKNTSDKEVAQAIADMLVHPRVDDAVRALALVMLDYQGSNYCKEVLPVLEEPHAGLTAAALRYLCRCASEEVVSEAVAERLDRDPAVAAEFGGIWQSCQGRPVANRPANDEAFQALLDDGGDAEIGQTGLSDANCPVPALSPGQWVGWTIWS